METLLVIAFFSLPIIAFVIMFWAADKENDRRIKEIVDNVVEDFITNYKKELTTRKLNRLSSVSPKYKQMRVKTITI